MKEQLRYCKNRECQQFEIPHLFQRSKRCQTCNGKTKFIEDYEDCPPYEYVDDSSKGKPGLILLQSSSQAAQEDGEPLVFGKGTHDKDNRSDCDLKGCPIAPESPVVCVPWSLYQKWVFLAQKVPVEWIAYLIGRFEEENEKQKAAYILNADGMYFPNQSATGAHVDAETCDELEGTIGSVHSHVDMATNFSDTDHDNFSRAVELVVNRSGSVGCVTRVKLACGKFERVKAHVELIGVKEMMECLNDLKEKLILEREKDDKASTSTIYTPGQGWTGGMRYGPGPIAVAKPDAVKEPSDGLILAALKVLRRSSKFRSAERVDTERLDHLMESFQHTST